VEEAAAEARRRSKRGRARVLLRVQRRQGLLLYAWLRGVRGVRCGGLRLNRSTRRDHMQPSSATRVHRLISSKC
jgi:hypothetical protein